MELSEDFTRTITHRIKNLSDLYGAIHKVLELLRLDAEVPPSAKKLPEDLRTSINHLFSSHIGISFASNCLKQQAVVRYSVCRNLLALIYILLEKREENWNSLEAIRSVCLVEIVVLAQAYHVVVWLTNLPALPILQM